MFSILNRALSWAITSFGNKFCLKKRSRLIKSLDNRFYVKFMQLGIGLFVQCKSFSVILRKTELCVSFRLRKWQEQQIPGELSSLIIMNLKEPRSLAMKKNYKATGGFCFSNSLYNNKRYFSNIFIFFGAKYIEKTVSHLNLLQISIYFHVSRGIYFFVLSNQPSGTHFSP